MTKQPTLGVYIHIPFCLLKCPYCDFNSVATKEIPEDRYTSSLLSELAERSEFLGLSGYAVDTVYFGGGTPSLLKAASIERVMRELDGTFALTADAEITLEANPATVSLDGLKDIRAAGVNRLSIGVQSFSDSELLVLGRAHSSEDALSCFHAAREAGFDNIGIDLIFAIPGQSAAGWTENLKRAVMLTPEHISAYSLTLEEGTPLCALAGAGELSLPSEEEVARMFLEARRILRASGYEHYEISNYARPGRRSRHNWRYWRGGDWLGLGAGAHSHFSFMDMVGGGWGIRSWNEREPERYMSLIEGSGIAEAGAEELTKEEAAIEAMLLGLRTISGGGVDREAFNSRFGLWPEDTLKRRRLFEEGLLTVSGGLLRLTERGMLFSDEVC